MKSTKTTALILALAFAGISSSMATPHIKTNDVSRKAREARIEQHQEQAVTYAAQSNTKQMSTVALYIEDEKKANKPLNFHRRHKLGIFGK